VRVLGISAYYHDSAAALVEDGRIVAAPLAVLVRLARPIRRGWQSLPK